VGDGRGLGAVVVGSGFGGRIHVPALRAAGFEVVALVGTQAERTARRAERLGVAGLTDLEVALALPGVQLVSVATPPATHAEVVVAALRAGHHVICEKPFATSVAEARHMVQACTEAGRLGLVGHEFRFLPERALLKRLVADGAVGQPRMATFVSVSDLVADPAARVPGWWFDPASGGGWLGASGSHLVDQLLWTLGPARWVSAGLCVVSDRPPGSAEDSFSLLVGLEGGGLATLTQSAATFGPGASLARVAGPKGSLRLEHDRLWLDGPQGGRAVAVPPELSLPAAPPPSADPRHRFSHLELGPWVRLAEVMRHAILGQGLPAWPAPADFSDGLACTQVLEAARRSAAAGGERVELGSGPA